MTQLLMLGSAILVGGILALAQQLVPRIVGRIGAWRKYRAKLFEKEKRVRFPLARALAIADQVLARLALHDAVLRCSCAGSVRRMQGTVSDIDLVVASERPEEVVDAFLSHTQGTWRKKRSEGWQTKATTPEGLSLELYVVPPKFYGPTLLMMSGGRAHAFAITKRALQCIYGEYFGLVRYWIRLPLGMEEKIEILMRLPQTSNTNEIREGEREISEEELYERLGMQWIPPTLREGLGGVEAALEWRVPRVIELSDIRGDLRSSHSDRLARIRNLALAAAKRGYEYLAITDVGEKLSVKSIERQRAEVRRLNEELRGRLSILHGVELSIGPNGELNDPNDILEGVELVIASIHDGMDQPPRQITRRLLKAIEHPRVNIIRHPTGRWIGERKPYAFDFDEVCQSAIRHRVALEINGQADRTADEHLRRVIASGVKLTVSAGACCVADLVNIRLGVAVAQRGWATAEHVVNAWPLERLKQFLAKTAAP
jgi:DNA polymerase (family X)